MSPHEDPQEAVARARAQVLSGRGPGASEVETARHKHERPMLGPLPAPLERELVHLNTVQIRSGEGGGVDPAAVRLKFDRLKAIWPSALPDHSRSMRGRTGARRGERRSRSMDVVVVTGASGGTGRAAARMFAEQGAAVALLARGRAGLDAAALDVRAAGGQALTIQVDVADHEALAAAAEQVETELGPIDTWVNVAMTSVLAPFTQIEPDEFKRVTEVTYLGYVYGTRAALDRMLPRDRGTIIQVGSALAYRGIPLQSAYCGAKHAIRGLHESLRCELLHEGSGVQTTMVHLPGMNTPQFDWALTRLPRHAQPVPPIYQPEVGARAIVHAAAHPGRREYWVGGSTVGTIIANKFAGGLLDRYLARTAVESQQTDQPHDPTAPVNLWKPADDSTDHGARGPFSDRSIERSYQLWASWHRHMLGAVTGAVGGLGLGVWGSIRLRRRRRRSRPGT